MPTLTTRLRSIDGSVSALFTMRPTDDGRYDGEFLADTPVMERPYDLRTTYTGDFWQLISVATHALDVSTSYAVCCDCEHAHMGEEFTYDGVTQFLCYGCGNYGSCDDGGVEQRAMEQAENTNAMGEDERYTL